MDSDPEIRNDSNNNVLRHSFYQFLNSEEKELIEKYGKTVHYRKNNSIFIQNTLTSHIMFIESELIKVFREGRMEKRIIINIETPGNFLGLMSVFGRDTHEFSASAIEPSNILFIDINVFKHILKNNSNLSLYLLHLISISGIHILEKLVAQTHKQLPGRVADVLLYFSEKIYKSQRFTFPLTRRELAELAGTTKESFIRTLTEFKNDKIIEIDNSDVQIISMKIVKTLSELG